MQPPELPKLKLEKNENFGAALYAPGLASDLSTWTITIDNNGLLTQTVLLEQPPTFDKQLVVFRQHVSVCWN